MKRRRRFILGALVVFLACLGFAGYRFVANRMATPFPLGRETTFLTEPLDQHGYVDYQAG
jgi:hypothetical protein